MNKIKKGDEVIITVGKDKGKKGVVKAVMPKVGKLTVEKLNIVTKHVKGNEQNKGSIEKLEGQIDASNVRLISPESKKGEKVGFVTKDDKKMRKLKKSSYVLG
ncbi:50S ribosomal protein L24 [bacterium]|jgi:large subunit ribosomal protein L24|nr:50S ribosomal protein L24 [bacterium]